LYAELKLLIHNILLNYVNILQLKSTVTVNKWEEICVVNVLSLHIGRLDLEEFSLLGPHMTMGICRSDRFVAMTSLPNGIGISELCGENAGQHCKWIT
jgi:hypothetical protein